MDLRRMMSAPARELLGIAAGHALESGTSDLHTDHLLQAATKVAPARTVLQRAGVDPERLAAEVERGATGGPGGTGQPGDTGQPSTLTPAAKQALLDGDQIARALASSYIGPEHILLALSANPDFAAGRLLGRNGLRQESLKPGPSSFSKHCGRW